MIKMSKRQQQQLEKRSAGFMGEFKKLLYRHQAWEVWSDFCTMAAISIANAVDKALARMDEIPLSTARETKSGNGAGYPDKISFKITDVSEYWRNHNDNGAVKQADGTVSKRQFGTLHRHGTAGTVQGK
jgi:hypothetical protein